MTDLERIKKDVVEMDSRANVCWHDTKVLTKAVRLILEELTADRKTESSSEKPNKSEIPTGSKPQTENPCDGCVCDDGKHLMYCMNCKGIAWKTEPPKIEDEPQTERSE